MIPFLDLVTPHRELEEELVDVVPATAPQRAASSAGRWSKSSRRISRSFCDSQAFAWVSRQRHRRAALCPDGRRCGSRRHGRHRARIRLLRRPKRSRRRARVRCSSTSTSSTYNMDPEKLREYLEQECHVGRGDSASTDPQEAGRPRHGGRAGASLRTDGGHGRDPGDRRAGIT